MDTNWATLIKEIRTASGMSQKAVASALGYYQANVSRLESKKQKKVSYEIGERIKRMHRQYARAA